MAFDRDSDADLQKLQDEVFIDPIGQGYAQFLETSTNKLLDLLNVGDQNNGLETTAAELTVDILLDEMIPGEFSDPQMDEGGRLFAAALLGRGSEGLGSTSLERWKDKLITTLPNNSTTESNINALIRRIGRVEIPALFGLGTVISKEDWAKARAF